MANDLQNLGTASLFTLDPNWVSNPKYNLIPLRRLIAFAGTADSIQSLGSVPVFSCNANYLLYNRVRKNYFLTFMNTAAGRCNRFWFKHPYTFFTLKNNAGIGALKLYVERQEFDWIYQGYERIYIQMGNGDVITRKITSVVESVPNNRLELSFTPGLDRAVNVADKNTIGRLLLCRFDVDSFSLKTHIQTISEITTRVVELLYEYVLEV